MINKFKKYISNHKFYLGVMIFFTLCLSIIVSQVVLYADDFSLHAKALKYDINIVLHEFSYIYSHWGGGPTPGFAIIVLMLGLTFWKIMNIIMISSSVHMFVNMVIPKNKRNDKNRSLVAFIVWSFIFLMNIGISRETMFWFDGSMAYVLTTFLSISYIYCCYKFILEGKKVLNWHYVAMCVLGFFAGWNGPQAGAITVLIGFLFVLWQKFIKKEKVNKLILISNFFLLAGFIILYIAPGNAIRAATFKEYSALGFLDKIIYRLDVVVDLVTNCTAHSHFMLPTYFYMFAILLVGVSCAIKNKIAKRDKKLYMLSIIISIAYIFLYGLYLYGGQNHMIYSFLHEIFNYTIEGKNGVFDILILYFNYAFFISFLLSLLYLSWQVSKNRNQIMLFIAFIGAIGTQVAMLMAPYSPPRSIYITIIFFVLAIAILVYELRDNKEVLAICMISGLCFYQIEYALWLIIIFILLHYLPRKVNYYYLVFIMILVPVISTIMITFKGYRMSRRDNMFNLQQIEKFKDKGQKGTLVFYKLRDENFAFTPLYSDAQWIRDDVIKYFNLKNNVKIKVK